MTVALVLADSGHVFTPSPAKGGLIVLGLAVLFVACWVRDRRRHPYVPRRGCNGGVRRSKWNPNATGPCTRHSPGQHMRRRWGSGIQ